MFVYFWQAVVEVVFLMVDGVGERQLDEVQFGKNLLHLRDDKVLNTIVVVNMQKAAADKVGAKILSFLAGKRDVAVACDVHKWVVE